MIIISLISSLFLIPIDNLYTMGFTQFFIFSCIIFISSNALEALGSSLMAKIIPYQNDNFKKLSNPGLMIILTTTGGRFIGSILITLFGYYGLDMIQFLIFAFFCFCYLILLYFVMNYYHFLRVKAISRIIKKKYIFLLFK